MDPKAIVFLIGGLAGSLALYLAMYVLAIRMQKPMLRIYGGRAALVIAAVVVANGLNAYLQNQGPPDFVTEVPGPPTGSASTLREVNFHIHDGSLTQLVEITMRAEFEAKGNLSLICRVLDPQKKMLKLVEQEVVPAGGKLWSAMRFEFQAETAGEHMLAVEIPKGVDIMRVVAKELK